MKNLFTKLARTTRTITTLAVVSFLITLLAGCDGFAGSPKTENTGCTVSGNLIISGDATAGRSATTSLSFELSTAEELEWHVYATYSEENQDYNPEYENNLVSGTVSNLKYSVKLPKTGIWELDVRLHTEGASLLSHEDISIDVVDAGSVTGPDLVLHPSFTGLNGAINLTLYDETSNKSINSVSCKAVPALNGIPANATEEVLQLYNHVEYFSNSEVLGKRLASIIQSDTPTGSYEVTLSFNDEAGNTLYSCKETITVFAGFTTELWFGTGSHLRKNEQGATEFVITDETLSVFGVNDVLLYEPNTIEYNGMGNDESGYDYYLVDISEVSEKPEKTAVSARYSTNYLKNFTAFDSDGNFYLLQASNDTGVTLSSGAFEWTEPTLGFDNNDYSYIQGFAIDRTNNNICILKLDSTSFVIYDYPELVSSKGTKLPTDYNDHPLNLTYYPLEGFVVNAGIAYLLIRNMDSYDFYRYEFNQYSDPLDSQPVTIDLKTLLGFTSINTNTFKITDMLYQDGAIYILVKNHSEITSGSNAISSEYPIYARGAVIKYDVSSGETNVIGWTETPLDNTGKYLYGFSNSSMPTQLKYNETGENLKFSTSDASSKFPNIYSPSDSDTSFYGPVKFIAIKPKKLIIADDGFAFYTDDEDAYNFKNVNRVVTVDLENFTINAIETNSEFEFDYNYTIIGSGFEASKPNVALDANSTQYEGSSVLLGIPCGDENN